MAAGDERTEGAWRRDVLIGVFDGLKGFPDAITAVFPDTLLEACIVHLIHNFLQLDLWKEGKALAVALKPISQADHAEAAERALSEFEQGPWGERFPIVAQSWLRNWAHVILFFAFSAPVRKVIYMTNAIESLHSDVRKSTRNKGHFPNDEAASKLIWLALRNITAKWKNPPIAWASAKAQFAIQFGDRFKLDD